MVVSIYDMTLAASYDKTENSTLNPVSMAKQESFCLKHVIWLETLKTFFSARGLYFVYYFEIIVDC